MNAQNPPAYSNAPAPRTIHDLRTQIVANGTILKPRDNNTRASDDHIELVLAKSPSTSRVPSFISEKQALAGGASSNAAAGSSAAGKHYALLLRRSYSKQDVRIIVKGEPRDTPEEALEWMLERTELMVHELVVKYGRSERDADCCVM